MDDIKILERFCRRLVALDLDVFGVRKKLLAMDGEEQGEPKDWRSLENG